MPLTDNQAVTNFQSNYGRPGSPTELSQFKTSNISNLSNVPDPTYALVPGANGTPATVVNKTTGKAYSTPQDFAKDAGVDPSNIDWTKFKFDTNYNPASQPYSQTGKNADGTDPNALPTFNYSETYNKTLTDLGADKSATSIKSLQDQISGIDNSINAALETKKQQAAASGGIVDENALRGEVAQEQQALIVQRNGLTQQLQYASQDHSQILQQANAQVSAAEKTYQDQLATFKAKQQAGYQDATLAQKTEYQSGTLDINADKAGVDPSTIPGTGTTAGSGGSTAISPSSTIQDFFNIYAPKGDGKNDPTTYANTVANALGIDASTPITALAGKETDMANAIATHEGYFNGTSKVAVANNNPGNLKFTGQPGATNSGGWAKFSTASAGMTALVNDIHAKIAKSYGLNTSQYKIAEDVANGNLSISDLPTVLGRSSTGASSAIKTNIYALATTLNPNFSATKFEQGQAFGASPQTQQTLAAIDSVKQTISLIQGYATAAQQGNIPLINKYTFPGKIAIGSVTSSQFQTVATALADELSGVLGYGSASDQKTSLAQELTDPTLSPAQFAATMQSVATLVNNRQTALQQQIWQGVGNGATGPGSTSSSSSSSDSTNPLGL